MSSATVTLLAGGLAIVGTLGGATLNHFLSKWKEEDARRQENKQRVNEEFAALALLPNRFFEASEIEHFQQLARILGGMNLYGAPDVLSAAKRAYNLELERDEHQEGSEEHQRLDAALESARGEFLAAARKE